MTTFKKYYELCQKNYHKNTNITVYNFTIDYNPKMKIPQNILDNLYNKILKELISTKSIKTDLYIGLIDNLYKLDNEIEAVAQIIIPFLEENIYGCYLNLMRCYVYKNLKTAQNESSSWLWHWDNHPDEFLKVIIYLTNTNSNDGPFEFLKHNISNKGYKMPTNRLGPYNWGTKNHPIHKGCRISHKNINKMCREGYKPFKVIGKKGSIIFFRQNIVHKANIPKNNERIILTLQVKPILNKREKYFDRKYTGTFENEIGGAIGSRDPYNI